MALPPESKPRTLDIRKLVWIVVLLFLCLLVLFFRSVSDPYELIGIRLSTVDAGNFSIGIDLLAAVLLGSVAAAILIWFFEIDFRIEAEDSRFLKRITASMAGSGAVAFLLICATYWVLWDGRQKNTEINAKLAISSLFLHKQGDAEKAQLALVNQGTLQAKLDIQKAKLEIQQELLQLALGSGTAKMRLDLNFYCKSWNEDTQMPDERYVDNVALVNERASDDQGPSSMTVAEGKGYGIDMTTNGKSKRIADISFKMHRNGNPIIVVGITKGFRDICATNPSLVNVPSGETEPPPAPLN